VEVTHGILKIGHLACIEYDMAPPSYDKWQLTVHDDVAQVDDMTTLIVDR
jgi:hypothetical protein